MKLIKKTTFFILLFLIISMPSCKEEKPREFDDETSNELLYNSITSIQKKIDMLFVGGEMGACWSQQVAKIQHASEALYKPREVIIRRIWEDNYQNTIARTKELKTRATSEGNDNLKGAALVVEAYTYLIMTDLFGNILFENIEEGANLVSQPDIYSGVINKLKEANILFGNKGGIDASADVLYDGDPEGWKKLANSLLFRLFMRISSKMDVGEELQKLFDEGYLFSSVDEECKLKYGIDIPERNNYYELVVYGSRHEWRVHESLVEILKENNDPRLAVYAQENSEGEYVGTYSSEFNSTYDVSYIGSQYLDENAPGYLMSYSELMFLIAEAGKKGMLEIDAEYYYYEGIKASFVMNNLDMSLYDTYITEPNVVYNDNIALEQIGIQNWLGLYLQGIESWTEWRRTGFPQISPTLGGYLDEIPSRFTYPTYLPSLNNDSYNNTINDQGPDELTTRLWWME